MCLNANWSLDHFRIVFYVQLEMFEVPTHQKLFSLLNSNIGNWKLFILYIYIHTFWNRRIWNRHLKCPLQYLKKWHSLFQRPNSEIPPGNFSIWPLNFLRIFFENYNSKLSAKFSSTLILKISCKNIKRCKSLSVLSERVLRKNVNRDMATFVQF